MRSTFQLYWGLLVICLGIGSIHLGLYFLLAYPEHRTPIRVFGGLVLFVWPLVSFWLASRKPSLDKKQSIIRQEEHGLAMIMVVAWVVGIFLSIYLGCWTPTRWGWASTFWSDFGMSLSVFWPTVVLVFSDDRTDEPKMLSTTAKFILWVIAIMLMHFVAPLFGFY